MKYFILGSFSSAFLLYGIALTYGATSTEALPGTTNIAEIARRFFFLQAEDGIRELYVTGVQTCALPIFGRIDDETVGLGVGEIPDQRGHTADACVPAQAPHGAARRSHAHHAAVAAEVSHREQRPAPPRHVVIGRVRGVVADFLGGQAGRRAGGQQHARSDQRQNAPHPPVCPPARLPAHHTSLKSLPVISLGTSTPRRFRIVGPTSRNEPPWRRVFASSPT